MFRLVEVDPTIELEWFLLGAIAFYLYVRSMLIPLVHFGLNLLVRDPVPQHEHSHFRQPFYHATQFLKKIVKVLRTIDRYAHQFKCTP